MRSKHWILLFLLLSALPTYSQDICAKAPEKCCGATSFKNCPLDGCGGDPKLNARKNTTDIPDQATGVHQSIIDIANFTHPAKWKSGSGRSLLKTWGEGKALEVTLFLKAVKHYKDGAEACNCNLKDDKNNDFHIVLVTNKNDPESESLTAEITPRIRSSGWTLAKLQKLAHETAYVRVTGWALLDTQHVGKNTPVRKTHWEIHPVTRFEVCTTSKTKCDSGDGWRKLEDMQ